MTGVPEVWLRVGDADGNRFVEEARAEITQFKVFTRVRPFIAEEKKRFGNSSDLRRSVVEMSVEDGVETTFVCNPKDGWRRTHSFTYDRCLWSIPDKLEHTCKAAIHKDWVDQAETYRVATTDPVSGYSVVDNAFLGINAHIMTYGQTSSGKTHTMLGNYGDEYAEAERGIIPRVCDELFTKVQQRREYEAAKKDPKKRWKLSVTVSFVEIYCEKVRNLLEAPRSERGHKAGDMAGGHTAMREVNIRGEGTASGPFLAGVEPKVVENWEDCKRCLKIGARHRTTAATEVHDQSSRSHAIFTIILTQSRDVQPEGSVRRYDKEKQEVKIGRINLIDLAGSERGGGKDYQKESSAINTSLHVLRKVIEALADRQQIRFEQLTAEQNGLPPPSRRAPEVPQRESVLTRLLDLEGANAKAVMIANLTPSSEFYDETLRTLEWSHKSRRLVTVVRANTSDSAEVLEGRMHAMNLKLKGHLADQKSNVDSLQEELRRRAQAIKELADRNEKTEQRISSLDERYRRAKEKRNATFIQLFFYRNMLRRVRERRQRELQQKEKQKAEEEQELRRVQQQYAQLKDELQDQSEQMARIKQKAQYLMSDACDTSGGGPAVDLEEMKAKQQQQEAELKKKRAELDRASEQRQLAEGMLSKFEEQRSEQEERRRREAAEQEERMAKMKDDMYRELLSDLTASDVLANLGVGPIPDDFSGAHPEATYGEGVCLGDGDKGMHVFERYEPDGEDPLADTVMRQAGKLEQWVVSKELKAKAEEAKRRLDSAKQEAAALAQQKSALESETRSLQDRKAKAQDEHARLTGNVSALDQRIKELEKRKSCC